MFRNLFGLLLMAVVAASVAGRIAGQDQPKDPNPQNQVDTQEIQRWGDRVTISGEGPRAGDEVLYSMSMATPVDDSSKWFITVWGHSKDQATLAVKQAFERDKHLAIFVADPPSGGLAWAHFNLYFADDGFQAWRFKQYGLDPAAIKAWPYVSIQTPVDGSFGGIKTTESTDPRTGKKFKTVSQVVVDMIPPEAMQSPEALGQRIRNSVSLWCRKLAEQGFVPPERILHDFYGGKVPSNVFFSDRPMTDERKEEDAKLRKSTPAVPSNGKFPLESWPALRPERSTNFQSTSVPLPTNGPRQAGPLGPVGPNKEEEEANAKLEPPRTGSHSQGFPFPANSVPAQPSFNPVFPQGGPAADQALTLQQLKALVPDATAEFLMEQLTAKAANPDLVLLAWDVYKKKNNIAPTNPIVPNIPITTPSIWSVLMGLFGIGGWGSALAMGLILFRKMNKKPILTEQQFALLIQIVKEGDTEKIPELLMMILGVVQPPPTVTPAMMAAMMKTSN